MGIVAEVAKRSRLIRPVRTKTYHPSVPRRPILLVVVDEALDEVLVRVYGLTVVKGRVKGEDWDVPTSTRERDHA